MIKNVIIAGVGGQGTIFAGKILGTMAYQTGLHVKISEIHGMSQRGGSVVTQVRHFIVHLGRYDTGALRETCICAACTSRRG